MAAVPSAEQTIEATRQERRAGVRLGLRVNPAQFSLLVAVNALAGCAGPGAGCGTPARPPGLRARRVHRRTDVFILAFGTVKPRPTSSPEPCPTVTAADPSWCAAAVRVGSRPLWPPLEHAPARTDS